MKVLFQGSSVGLTVGLGVALLAGCSSPPQACGQVEYAVDELKESIVQFDQSRETTEDKEFFRRSVLNYLDRLREFADTPAAEQAGLADPLKTMVLGMTQDVDDPTVVGQAVLEVEDICGFSPFPLEEMKEVGWA